MSKAMCGRSCRPRWSVVVCLSRCCWDQLTRLLHESVATPAASGLLRWSPAWPGTSRSFGSCWSFARHRFQSGTRPRRSLESNHGVVTVNTRSERDTGHDADRSIDEQLNLLRLRLRMTITNTRAMLLLARMSPCSQAADIYTPLHFRLRCDTLSQ